MRLVVISCAVFLCVALAIAGVSSFYPSSVGFGSSIGYGNGFGFGSLGFGGTGFGGGGSSGFVGIIFALIFLVIFVEIIDSLFEEDHYYGDGYVAGSRGQPGPSGR